MKYMAEALYKHYVNGNYEVSTVDKELHLESLKEVMEQAVILSTERRSVGYNNYDLPLNVDIYMSDDKPDEVTHWVYIGTL